MAAITAFNIAAADHLLKNLLCAIQSAPEYGVHIRRVIKHTIRVIHATPDITQTLELPEIDIRLGRSTPKNVLNRWREHNKKFKHVYGAVLFRCSAPLSLKYEKLALKLLEEFRKRGRLCVGMANVALDGRGNTPGEDTAVIYLTWGKTQKPTNYKRPTRAINRKIAEVVYKMSPEIGLEKITRKVIEKGLESARAPLTEKASMKEKRL